MEVIKSSNLLQFLLLNLTIFFFPSVTQTTSTSFCGKIKIQTPFSLQNFIESSPLSQMLLCKSQKLYFRTSIGLFPVSSIDYKTKTITISHTSCSSSLQFVSPTLLSAGFPSPSEPNSLLLFNCLKQRKPMSSFSHNCTSFYGCRAQSESLEQPSSCWFVDDSEKLEMGFDPKDLNCSHYSRIYKDSSSSSSSFGEKYELGTRISFEIPDHIPNICNQCTKTEGNCGVGFVI